MNKKVIIVLLSFTAFNTRCMNREVPESQEIKSEHNEPKKAKLNQDIKLSFFDFIKKSDTKGIKSLIRSGGNVNSIIFNNTPLDFAVDCNKKEIVALLIESGADVNRLNEDGYAPIHKALRRDFLEIAKLLLLAKNADVNIRSNGNKWTPLHKAALDGHEEIVELLIKKGANVNITNPVNETPLHDAAKEGHKKIVELLLNAGADKSLINKDNNTSADLSKNQEIKETINNFVTIVKK